MFEEVLFLEELSRNDLPRASQPIIINNYLKPTLPRYHKWHPLYTDK